MQATKIVAALSVTAIAASITVTSVAYAKADTQMTECPPGTHVTWSVDRQAYDRCVSGTVVLEPPTRPCPTDEADQPGPCFWDAGIRGDGNGHSFWIGPHGHLWYVDGRLNTGTLGELSNVGQLSHQLAAPTRAYPTKIVGHFLTGWTVTWTDGTIDRDPPWAKIKVECSHDPNEDACLTAWLIIYHDRGIMRAIIRGLT